MSDSKKQKIKYPSHWTNDDISAYKASLPESEYPSKGLGIKIAVSKRSIKQLWDERVQTDFPGFSCDALESVGSAADIPRDVLLKLSAGEIYGYAIEVLGKRRREWDDQLAEQASHPSPGTKVGNGEHNSPSVTFVATGMEKKLGCSHGTLIKWIDKAGITRRGTRGQCYSVEEFIAICNTIIAGGKTEDHKNKAKETLAELTKNSQSHK